MAAEFKLPDLGEGIHEAQIINVAVKAGDTVKEDQVLMEVETDKAAVEIPSPQAGKIEQVHVKAGQTVNVGDVLVTFGAGAARGEAKAAEPAEEKPAKKTAPAHKEEVAEPATAAVSARRPAAAAHSSMAPARSGNGPIPASPAVRRMAREHNVDLRAVPGTGPGGRITQSDFDDYLAGRVTQQTVTPAAPSAPPRRPAAPAPMPVGTDADKYGPITREPLSQIRKTIANQMTLSYSTVPHVLHAEHVDMTELEALRKDYLQNVAPEGARLTYTPFIVKAVVSALIVHPKFNASFDHEKGEIIYKHYYNVGMAVDSPRGLIVPVVRDCDRKSVVQLFEEFNAAAARIRDNKFSIDELRGGTFTITNIGAMSNGVFFTPIINYPEVAILGVGRARMQAVVRDGQVVPRLIMPLCLSFDHRACDGADAARFMNDVVRYLEKPARLLL